MLACYTLVPLKIYLILYQLFYQDEDGNFQIPNDAELETNRNVVVYDETTASLPAQSKYCHIEQYLFMLDYDCVLTLLYQH